MNKRLLALLGLCVVIGTAVGYVWQPVAPPVKSGMSRLDQERKAEEGAAERNDLSQQPGKPERITGAAEPIAAGKATPLATPEPLKLKKGDLPALVQRVRAEVAAENPELVTALDALLQPEEERRIEAVHTLGFAENAVVLPAVFSILSEDPAAEVRAAAAAALDIHDASPQASTALVLALLDSDEDVRANAMLSLKAHRNATVERELRRKLLDGGLAPELAEDARIFLDRYYVRKDPFKNPLDK